MWIRQSLSRKAVLTVALFGCVAPVCGQSFSLSSWTVDSGSMVLSSGGSFELFAVIGQPDAGELTGGQFVLAGGFLDTVIIRPDLDRDGDVDGDDLLLFLACTTGATIQPASGCQKADFEGDADVDQSDFGIFQRCYSGKSMPVEPACVSP